ncbi:hypothetical protein TRIUR3_11166 [Triticum urartu]|uniref:Uncharacterized protein n=1 Tax=Triticum urartu TaxID=4572 RepID=M8A0V2_TRIUA|nr:hypothetical protein TRIUR3_11166 [Triticum urartu]
MKSYFSSVAATEVSTPGVLAGGNEGAERSEATPENETNAEMGPPPLTSNNPPSISTRESNIPDSARGQLREGDIQPDPRLRKPIESNGTTAFIRTLEMLLEGYPREDGVQPAAEGRCPVLEDCAGRGEALLGGAAARGVQPRRCLRLPRLATFRVGFQASGVICSSRFWFLINEPPAINTQDVQKKVANATGLPENLHVLIFS